MFTPKFRVAQDSDHVIVEVVLSSMHSRLGDAIFDIRDEQFSFHCRPYYLRLVFDQKLTEGKDERATYDVDSNTLKVFLPKATPGEAFTHLDDSAYLIATQQQRKQMQANRAGCNALTRNAKKPLIEVVASVDEKGDEEDDEVTELDTEYVQSLHNIDDPSVSGGMASAECSYGFNYAFSHVFSGLEEEVVFDAIELQDPDHTSRSARRVARVEREQKDFDEEYMWVSHADEDGEVAQVLQYRPYYIDVFEAALQRDGVKYIRCGEGGAERAEDNGSGTKPPQLVAEVDEDDGDDDEMRLQAVSNGKEVPIWEGNVECFDAKLMEAELNRQMEAITTTTGGGEEILPPGSTSNIAGGESDAEEEAEPVVVSIPLAGHRRNGGCASKVLAMPRFHVDANNIDAHDSHLFTMDDEDTLLRISQSALHQQQHNTFSSSANSELTPTASTALLFELKPNEEHVNALTMELLLAYVYDHLLTEGKGSSESVWTLCNLSPSLSFLDTLDTVYDAAVAFARRAVIYPLHRHLDLVRRCFRDVGVLCLLGPKFVVKSLLSVKRVLDHSEHKLVLSRIFLNPLIHYWAHKKSGALAVTQLQRLALELHDVATRNDVVTVRVRATGNEGAAVNVLEHIGGLIERQEQPIHLLSIGLPLEEE